MYNKINKISNKKGFSSRSGTGSQEFVIREK